MNNQPILSISILISNRPDTVEKCLKSLDNLRKSVPCELILTDTGCGAKVREIIESYADVLLDFTWCNDFAKARNLGLSKARGQWYMFLDDDEWFESTDEIEEFFVSRAYKQYGYAYYKVRNYKEMSGTLYNDTIALRMVNRTKNMRFEGKIHEHLVNMEGDGKVFEAYVHHYGYAYESEQKKYQRSQRNLVPLLEAHKEEPYNLHHTMQIAQEYNFLKEYRKSIEISMEGIENYDEKKTHVIFYNSLCVNVVERYLKLFQYEEALDYGRRFLEDKRMTNLAKGRLYAPLCVAAYKLARYEECAKFADLYLGIHEDYLNNREEYEMLGAGLMYGCLKGDDLHHTVSFGTAANLILGDYVKAREVFNYINFEEKVLTLDEALYEEAVNAYLHADGLHTFHPCVNILNKLWEYPQLHDKLISGFEKASKNAPDMVKEQYTRWQYLNGDCWYISYLKLTPDSVGKEAAEESYRLLWAYPEAVLPKSVELDLWERAENAGVDMGMILQEIPYYKWRNAVNAACNALGGRVPGSNVMACDAASCDELTQLYEQLNKYLKVDDCKALYWKSSYYHKQLMRVKENADGQAVQEVFEKMAAFAESTGTLAEYLYAPHVIEEEKELLPEFMQAAFCIASLFEYTQVREYAGAIRELKAVKELLPGIATAVKIYTKWIETQVKEQNAQEDADKQAAAAEMKQLEAAVKAQIQALLQQGNEEMATQLIAQLEAITGRPFSV